MTRCWAIGALWMLMCWCTSAHAETPEELQARAFSTFERGEAQFRDGHYDAAARLFQEAYEAWKDPAYLFNVGLAFEKGERWRLTVEWYDKFIREYPDVPNISEVMRRREAAQVSRNATRAAVMITTEPSGARADVPSDASVEACTTPCLLRVDAGPTTIRVVLGDRQKEIPRSMSPGEKWDLSLDMGKNSTTLPVEEPVYDRTGAVVVWAIGGAMLVTGTVFGVMADGDYDDGKALTAKGEREGGLGQDDLDTLNGLRDDVKRNSIIADVGFIGAVVGATVGTILWFTTDPEPAPRTSTSTRSGGLGTWTF